MQYQEIKRNLSKCDKIIVELNDLQSILDYVDLIPEKDRNTVTHILNEGVLVVQHSGFPSTNIYFEINENGIDFEVYIGFTQEDMKLMSKFRFNYQTRDIEAFGKWQEQLKDKNIQKDLRGYVFWVSMVTLYMAHVGNVEEIIVEEERIKLLGKNRHKSKNQSNKYTYITRKKYTLKAVSEEQKQKRDIVRHVESWTVRGHIRRLKNGKEIWVKPHIKGHGEVTPKKYKITT